MRTTRPGTHCAPAATVRTPGASAPTPRPPVPAALASHEGRPRAWGRLCSRERQKLSRERGVASAAAHASSGVGPGASPAWCCCGRARCTARCSSRWRGWSRGRPPAAR
eukprot:scaffold30978_cov65-Phaeocystis_antarctica.AAC.2